MVNYGDPLNGSALLEVTFPTFSVQGNNFNPVSASQNISVEDFNALFGEWSGTIYYTVDYTLHS